MASVSQAVTVSEVIESRPLGGFQIWTVTLCGLVLVLDGFDSQVINYTAPSIAETIHVAVARFGPVFSSGLFGLMIAAMATGPIADLWGRKWPVICSILSFAIFSLATTHVTSFNELLVLRFLTGLGLGGTMPNVVALAAEYVPRRLLPLFVPALFIGMPLGGTISGFVTAAMIPRWGWQSVFYVGGLLPLAIALLLIALLPESIQFLAAGMQNLSKVRRILARISPQLATAEVELGPALEDSSRRSVPVIRLFTEGRAVGTILLWIPYFMNLLLIYFTSSWLPALFRTEGMSASAAATAASFVSFGGIFGCMGEGFFIRRSGAGVVLLTQYALAGLSLALLARLSVSFSVVLVLTFVAGFMIIGAQGGLNALAASFYPTSVRSTGVGWALGVGRVGSIVGPALGGMFLTSFRWKPSQMLLFGAFVAACASVSILPSNFIRGHASAYSRESVMPVKEPRA